MTAYVYMLSCADGSLYTGWTNDLAKRLDNHQAGKGAKYTRSRLPVMLVYHETYETESEARKRECAIKKLTRQQKQQLIQTKQEQIAD
ncbi:MAG: GIY-YIG nuclease family protein [Selenomonadales bacterium]|nr:GIY-YIG nuclease family protein [Selenomonadales bacterium]